MHSARRFFRRWQNWLALLLVGLFVAMALTAPTLSPKKVVEPGQPPPSILGNRKDPFPQPPSAEEPLGTMPYKASVFHNILWGARFSLVFGLGVTVTISLIGILVGTLSAYYGGWLGRLMLWITDSFVAFPIIAAVVLINQYVDNLWTDMLISGSYIPATPSMISAVPSQETIGDLFTILQKIPAVAFAFVLFLWMPYARVMHASVRQQMHQEYVLAARVSGARDWRVMWRHLIPNAVSPLIVMAAKDVGALVVLQSAFKFAALDSSDSPWAAILISSKDFLYAPGALTRYWWLFVPAAAAIILFGIAWNLLGDGIQDALDPKAG